jgi:ketosteroid isomerase-like protein
MTMARSKAAIIRSLFDAYLTKQRDVVEASMSPDLRFTSPYDDAIDRATYFERCWPTSETMDAVEVERIFEEGNEAFVTYKTTVGGKTFRNTEFFVFDGDLVREITVYFGASYKDGVFVKQA